jgi:hypothetical protein
MHFFSQVHGRDGGRDDTQTKSIMLRVNTSTLSTDKSKKLVVNVEEEKNWFTLKNTFVGEGG